MKLNPILIALFAAGSAVAASAAPITGATFNIDPALADTNNDGAVDEPLFFTSITVNSTLYSVFTYGTASWANASRATDEYYYTPGDDPLSHQAALSGSTVTDEVLNVAQNVTVNFGRPITADELIFVTDLLTASQTAGETIAMGLIRSDGTQISGTAVLFGNAGAGGGANLLTFDAVRSSGQSTLENATLMGSAFSLSEFGDPGSNVPHGIYFSSSSANVLDPSVVGLAAIPEPTSASLLGFALGGLVLSRRRRRG